MAVNAGSAGILPANAPGGASIFRACALNVGKMPALPATGNWNLL
ncbi:MAG TPA: hypothetical protein VM943_08135 [Pyrinomonadaceae bacterium]|nr:hypothetical protein [Pyrinomonadaceae bacterium]